MPKLDELKKELHELRENTLNEYKEFEAVDFDSEKKEEWAKRNEKMAELVTQVKEATQIEAERKAMEDELEAGKAVEPKAIHTEAVEAQESYKTVGEQLTESSAYKGYMESGLKNITSELKWNPKYEFKTTLTESGYPPAVTRSDLVVPTAIRNPNTILDLIDTINTDQFQYKYLEETTFTNNSAPTAEGSALGENALAFTEKTENIRKIGSFLPVTEELLADVSAVQGYLDSRLQTMVQLSVTDQLLAGSGSGSNLTGLLNVSGINTEIQKDSFLSPDAIVMHPSDWYQVVTEVNAVTTSGSLNPLFVGAGQFGGAVGNTLWGLPIVLDTTRPAGTAIVGVFGGGQACHIVARQGMEVAMSDSHDENFVKDIMVMKATVRLGFPVYRPTAFCSITNI